MPTRVLTATQRFAPRPPVAIARIRLARGTITVNDKAVPLGAGLGVTADIRTGNRRIISWLLSPITTTVSQAAKEQ